MLEIVEQEKCEGDDRQVEYHEEEVQEESCLTKRGFACNVHYPGYNRGKLK